jgi:hypothetical protein
LYVTKPRLQMLSIVHAYVYMNNIITYIPAGVWLRIASNITGRFITIFKRSHLWIPQSHEFRYVVTCCLLTWHPTFPSWRTTHFLDPPWLIIEYTQSSPSYLETFSSIRKSRNLAQAITFLACIPEVPGSNFGQHTDYPEWFLLVSLSSSRQIPEGTSDLKRTASFHFLRNSPFSIIASSAAVQELFIVSLMDTWRGKSILNLNARHFVKRPVVSRHLVQYSNCLSVVPEKECFSYLFI